MKKGKIRIELMSDLCVSSGYSFAGIVDSDVCYDEFGLPYIPAKRLKGCMRETCENTLYLLYDEEKVNELFGNTGAGLSGSGRFSIGNAYIDRYEELVKELSDVKSGVLSAYVSPQEVLGRFSHVTGQTRLENGVADPGSLRYTRVINQYSPFNEDRSNLVFYADIQYEESDEKMLENILDATRHIGLHRNRGMGNVKCVFKPGGSNHSDGESSDKNSSNHFYEKSCSTDKVKLYFAIENIQPLMLSAQNEEISENYISGQNVLGALAARYLAQPNKNAEDEAFRDLFLNGRTLYSNLYPYDGENIYYPAPEYLNKLKKTGKLVYTGKNKLPDNPESEYDYRNGNQPKKLKGKFVAECINEKRNLQGKKIYKIKEVEKEIVYHHSHRNTHDTETGEEGILYTGEAVMKGQKFAGFVIVPEGYKETVKELIEEGDFFFGKSRTAQYGRCRLITVHKISDEKRDTDYGKDEEIIVTFLSDAIFTNDRGEYTVYREEVLSTVKNELGISTGSTSEAAADIMCPISMLQTKTVTGYSRIWNLRKAPIPAIAAGSCVAIKLKAGEIEPKEFIGERTLEGYGQIRIDKASDFTYDGVDEIKEKNLEDQDEKDVNISDRLGKLIVPIMADSYLDEQINNRLYADKDKSVKVSKSAIGRFKLMLMESAPSNGGMDNRDVKSEIDDFRKRINSIKTDFTRKEGENLVSFAEEFISEKSIVEWGKQIPQTLQEKLQKEISSRWGTYMMRILENQKYQGKE